MPDLKTINNSNNSRPIHVYDEMSSSYLSYAMSVIISRALPDVRDGLKPVHRRIIYAMYKGGFDWSKQFRKSARIVGDVIGKYHPHGDQAVYDALVRMTQDFSMSLPLIQGQGNFGSVDGDPPAAMRYTESRLSPVTKHIIDDIEKNTVSFKNNYDETEIEPTVLPSQFPNLLVNGAGGIAVGMATSIPPHNLREVINATIAFMDDRNLTPTKLMKYIPGPDFPTGGIIIGRDQIKEGYTKGKGGSFKVRGVIDVENLKNNKERLVIKSIPYQVNKSILTERIAELAREKKIEGISDIRDESNQKGIRLVLELRRNTEPEAVKRQLYKFTAIESSFGFNSLAIVNNQPIRLPLTRILDEFIKFREQLVIKRTKYELEKAQTRAHLLLGLSIAVENLNQIISIIKKSKNPDEARKNLIEKKWSFSKSKKLIKLIENKTAKSSYSFTNEQVEAILELRLQKLTALGLDEIEKEILKLADLITEYKKILNSKKALDEVIKKELNFIKDKFTKENDRRSEIKDIVLNYDVEQTIQKEAVFINITQKGYIKRSPTSSIKIQKRGGKGKSGIKTKEEDSVIQTLAANSHTPILFFSTQGLVYKIKAWKIPTGSAISKGKNIASVLNLKDHSTISSIMPLPENEAEWKKLLIVFATSNGKIRKNSLEDFINIQSNGKIAMKLEQSDKIVDVKICSDKEDIMLATSYGKVIRFMSKKLRVFKGRSSKGVKGIKLAEGDTVISLSIVDGFDEKSKEVKNLVKNGHADKSKIDSIKSKQKFIFSISENGYGKRTSFYEYRVTSNGGKGITGIKNSKRNGNIAATFPVDESNDVIISTNKGRNIRLSVLEINSSGRDTQGHRLCKVIDDEKVVSAVKVEDNIKSN